MCLRFMGYVHVILEPQTHKAAVNEGYVGNGVYCVYPQRAD